MMMEGLLDPSGSRRAARWLLTSAKNSKLIYHKCALYSCAQISFAQTPKGQFACIWEMSEFDFSCPAIPLLLQQAAVQAGVT